MAVETRIQRTVHERAATAMSQTILQRILETKTKEVELLLDVRGKTQWKSMAREGEPVRDFMAALRTPPAGRAVSLIAEIKRASPSAGMIRKEFHPRKLATAYESAGAQALSVLTDEMYFKGNIGFMTKAREVCSLPVLRKDFIIDEVQVLEARAADADAILLIAEALEANQLQDLAGLAGRYGMACLVEVHHPEELDKLGSGLPGDWVLGINNRDLASFEVDLAATETIAAEACRRFEVPLVSESGLRSPADVARVAQAGANAVLVGETFMRQEDVASAVLDLLGPTE